MHHPALNVVKGDEVKSKILNIKVSKYYQCSSSLIRATLCMYFKKLQYLNQSAQKHFSELLNNISFWSPYSITLTESCKTVLSVLKNIKL